MYPRAPVGGFRSLNLIFLCLSKKKHGMGELNANAIPTSRSSHIACWFSWVDLLLPSEDCLQARIFTSKRT
jgi:hypothetical protein